MPGSFALTVEDAAFTMIRNHSLKDRKESAPSAISPRNARVLVGVGLACYSAMFVANGLAAFAIIDALSIAKEAVEGDLPRIAGALSRASHAIAIGTLLGPIGFTLGAFAIMKGHARARWIYWCCLMASIAYLVIVPIGTVLGILGIVHFRRRKAEYLKTGSFPTPPSLPLLR